MICEINECLLKVCKNKELWSLLIPYCCLFGYFEQILAAKE